MAQNEKNALSAPIFVGPSITTCDARRQSSPSSTSAPITQYGPILQDAGILARASMIAVECMFPETEVLGNGFIEFVAVYGPASGSRFRISVSAARSPTARTVNQPARN